MTTTDTRRAEARPMPDLIPPGGHQSPHRATTSSTPAYETRGEDQDTRPATMLPASIPTAPGGSDSLADLTSLGDRPTHVGEGHDNRTGRTGSDSRGYFAGAVQESGTGQSPTGDRTTPAGAAPTRPAEATRPSPPIERPPRLDDPTLNAAAALVDDIERTRIAAEHRLRILTRPTDEADEDGMCRGHGVPEDHPTPAALRAVAEALAGVEHQAVLELQRAMRRHPLGPWVKASRGIGEKQGARLLAAVGDPYFNARDQRPRTVSQLWAYAGLHTLPAGHSSSDDQVIRASGDQTGGDPGQGDFDAQSHSARVAARRRKGERANWSTTAKTRAYLVAVSCMKSPGSPYRDLYLARREHTAMTHPEWTAGHSHNDALRIVAKRVLRDAWRAARDIHLAAEEAPR